MMETDESCPPNNICYPFELWHFKRFFLAFKMPLFGVLNANIRNKNATFWHFKCQIMKLHKS